MILSRNLRRVVTGSLLAGAALISTQALAAYSAHMSVKGAKQGQLKSEGAGKRADKWIPLVSYSSGIEAPRDPATGAATGRRQWKPVCVVKPWGASSPQFLQAVATNETLTEVNFEFTRAGGVSGEEVVYQTVKLTDAYVSRARSFTANSSEDPTASKRAAAADASELEEICFSFRKIEVSNVDGRTNFSDSLQNP
jgi:type VI secretion system secreted protein Hcp